MQLPIGKPADDVLHIATATLNKVEIFSVTESRGPPIKLLSCCNLLKDPPKYYGLLNPPAVPEPTVQGAEDDEGHASDKNDPEEFKRRVGRKRMKIFQGKAELDSKREKIAETTLNMQKERIKLMKSQQEMLLFNSTANTSKPIFN